ncbi:MAG: adenylyl-sulfate kinase [Candidatus Peribacteraceae bacterium]|jgi:adenylylsulfate kinase|nr:adenylyl-sulfate kinase [Candidatus Peribacteraceae bacterium]MDP7454634.1 adenylyl-sulfate kinase [Candidatus Peribacteraceae bacterium]MDP7645825.1 adenylyl-sulfate kinase [Candidatus Peribacteraceae bacterium]|tara:strand:+ start:748 stop:1278 length:531 start_codon:yes stop_codon:yes gene_type:complete
MNSNPPIIWLTGNSGSGKTTLAYGIRDYFNESDLDSNFARRVIVLDGDEMRSTISIDEGFSPEDRKRHNLRVARLAKLMTEHGFLVIVAVIAPFNKAREEVSVICNPKWVYLKRSGLESEDRPYESPINPDLTVDNDELSVDEARNTLISYLRGLEIGIRKPKSMPIKHKDSVIKR